MVIVLIPIIQVLCYFRIVSVIELLVTNVNDRVTIVADNLSSILQLFCVTFCYCSLVFKQGTSKMYFLGVL